MNTKVIIGIIVCITLFLVGCTVELMTDSPQGAKALGGGQEEKTGENEETTSQETIQLLNKRYSEIHSIDVSKIDCNNPEHYNIGLMKFTMENWVDETQNIWLNNSDKQGVQTATWYPSLKEGKFGSLLLGETRNIGCTKIYPVYSTFVEFNNQIIFSSKKSDFPTTFGDDWYPQEWSLGGTLPVSGNVFEPLVVHSKGDYTIWVMVSNKNTDNLIALEKIVLAMG